MLCYAINVKDENCLLDGYKTSEIVEHCDTEEDELLDNEEAKSE